MYVRELTKRPIRGEAPKPITGPDDVVALIGPSLVNEKREHFVVLVLNTRHECQAVETISIGSLESSMAHPREVFRPAILQAAAAVVLVHNHPSGDPEPSEEDLSITKRLRKAGLLLGINVIDHIIVASRGNFSMRDAKLLSQQT